jgi:hypothetical protein
MVCPRHFSISDIRIENRKFGQGKQWKVDVIAFMVYSCQCPTINFKNFGLNCKLYIKFVLPI